MAPCYIVAGGGRTGSHWVQEMIRHITGYELIKHTPDCLPAQTVFHTHDQSDLMACADFMSHHAVLVLSKRRDYFHQAMSLAVAMHTDEWHEYSAQEVEPIELSFDALDWLMYRCRVWNEEFDRNVRPRYHSIIEIDYEDLRSTGHRAEQLVAQRLGIVYDRPPGVYQAPNHRDYTKIIANYDQLARFTAGLVSAH